MLKGSDFLCVVVSVIPLHSWGKLHGTGRETLEREVRSRRQETGEYRLEDGPVKVPIEEQMGEMDCCELGWEGRGQGSQGPRTPIGIG